MTTSPQLQAHTVRVPLHCNLSGDGLLEDEFTAWLDRGWRIVCRDSLRGEYEATMEVPVPEGQTPSY